MLKEVPPSSDLLADLLWLRSAGSRCNIKICTPAVLEICASAEVRRI